jgi:hypothetical protein
MKLPVISKTSLLIATILCSGAVLFAAQKCNCPSPPGGGVTCTKTQFATCDPSKGVCDCKCEDIPTGKTRDEYISIIFGAALDEKVGPTDLATPRYQMLSKKFVESESNGMFFIPKKNDQGETVQVTIGVPDWLARELKEGYKKDEGPTGIAKPRPYSN